jgi:flavin reductase
MSRIAAIDHDSAVSSDLFKAVMRQVASPVAIVTAEHSGHRAGLTATAVCSVSADPPTVLICVNRHAKAEALITASGAFAINYLGADQAALARVFSTSGLTSGERFRSGEWSRGATGSPILGTAIGVLDCTVVKMLPSDTHHVFIGRVRAAEALDGPPLLYRDGYFRRLASE